jgi:hypothetical protein
VILPPDLLERIERHVVGVARHVSWLRASGQHLERGGAAADRGDDAGAPLTVRDAHMNAALDELLDSRNRLIRALLGGRAAQSPPALPEPVTP